MSKPNWSYPADIWPGLLVSLSLIGLALSIFGALYSFSHTASLSHIDGRIWYLLRFTILQASISTILSLIVGIILAWSLAHQTKFPFRNIIIALFSSSLVLPSIIVAFGIITVLGNNGWINHFMYLFGLHGFGGWIYGLSGILIAHVYFNASFAARSMLLSFESIPVQRYKLSASLGLSLFQRFKLVEWPAIKGNTATMSVTIFLLCFNSFAIVLLLGGSPSYNTLEVAIYEAIKIDFDIPFALKLAILQLSISAILIVASSFIRAKTSQIQSSNPMDISQSKLSKWIQRSVISILSLVFVFPILAIIVDGFGANLYRIIHSSLFVRSFYTSIAVGFSSAVLSVIVALMIANTMRSLSLSTRANDTILNKLISSIVAFSSNLYLSIPSLIMGFGFFLLSRLYKAPLIVWAMAALISANVLMSLPFALSNLYPAMQKSALKYDKLSRSLSMGILQRWHYIEWPHLRNILGYVFALSFALSLGDLGVIALFGSDKITTLPWYLYQLMGSYHTTDAAGVALILLVLVLFIFILIPKLFQKKQ